ncbi:FAD-dependent monooxygenase [Kibdelosporangium lantanae]
MTVLIAGGGPNGLFVACELRLAGVDAIVLEQLPERADVMKANGMVGQVVRLLDHRGLHQRIGGPVPFEVPGFVFGAMPLALARLDRNPLTILPVPQRRLERILEDRALELGVEIRRGHELVSYNQDDDQVTARVRGPEGEYDLAGDFLVGADGGRSAVRKAAGIGFPGVSVDDKVSRSASVTLPDESIVDGQLVVGDRRIPGTTFIRTETGVFVWSDLEAGRPSLTTIEFDDGPGDDVPMTLDEMRDSIRRVLGADVPFRAPEYEGPHLLRRLTGGNTRIAERYRDGRVFLVGDAAHVHPGIGGPGLNLGMQDGANLAWKLAAVLAGWAPAGLLDTYETERRPLAERVVTQTMAQTALISPGPEVTALREIFGELLADKGVTQHIADTMAGADISYFRGDHPLVGRFLPDIPLADGRIAEHMRAARPVLFDFAGVDTGVVDGWAERVAVVRVESPAAPAAAVLVRPDGYVVWAGDNVHDGLGDALGMWFGTPELIAVPQ